MQLRCFTVSENRFTRFGCVKFWAMKIQSRNLFDKSICWSLDAVFSTSWWLYMRQVESNVRCCDSPNSRRHWKRADRRVPEEEQSYWCVEVAVIGDPYGMSIDMSASYLVLFNTLISSELKVEIRAGKSKSLIRWKRRKGGKRWKRRIWLCNQPFGKRENPPFFSCSSLYFWQNPLLMISAVFRPYLACLVTEL